MPRLLKRRAFTDETESPTYRDPSERFFMNQVCPERPFYKHQLMAPGLYTGYSAKTLPGIREAAEAKRWAEANDRDNTRCWRRFAPFAES